MLPALAGPIIGAVGAIGGGIASGKGAQSAASQARAAAEAQARQVTEANRENMYGGFGFEKAGKEYNFLYGGDIDRFGAFRDAKLESALQQGPAAQAANRIQMAQNLALRQQELFGSKPGGAPMTRFV
jgi:hypothetical protein